MRSKIVRFLAAALATAGVLAAPGRADAGFLGKTLSYEYLFPNTSTVFTSSTFVVTGGVERTSLNQTGNGGSDFATFDVSDNSITVDFYNPTSGFNSWSNADFNGFHVADTTNNVIPITGVTVNPATNMVGFTASNVSFDANNIFVNWQSLRFNSDTLVRLDVTFAGGSSIGTPLPPTLLAGFLGMAMLAGVRRFRKA